MMNASSSKKVDKVQKAAQRKILKPRWLEAFLRKTFVDSCAAYPVLWNELNKYCIKCDMPACQYCLSSGTHRDHRIIKIYRHVYKDVVTLGTMEKYIDCSQIQVTAVSRKPCDSVPPFISIQSPTPEIQKNVPEPQKPVRKRKGTPCRARFF
ncbi:PLATZ transcription factor family protein [Quillaja saponaria]|uniref:PLATZ transcription factor family protein n=1 Tax=Quillaja saponaria TaxID=32244 RepID=A0AAD7LKX7_QUISA|nr:PLATZ transcription factor family protein [Quillaja saponaria]KAJ7960066.1 PLATZ transcription factor family protein [Quillaja saponaria]